MKGTFIFYIIAVSCLKVSGQFSTTVKTEYSGNVGDSFQIYISLPPSYQADENYNVVYYCDANLRSGKRLRNLLADSLYYGQLTHHIFVGIGHTGNNHARRRRDFILPSIKGKDTVGRNKHYGQIRNFYAYVKEELIPATNARFKTNADSNSLIGHSLGGLFCFFCLFQSGDLFARYFALSPALWVHHYSIYRFNHIDTGFDSRKYLYFTAGSKERLNHILSGTNKTKAFLNKRRYHHLVYEYDIIKGKAHHSEVPVALKRILTQKLWK